MGTIHALYELVVTTDLCNMHIILIQSIMPKYLPFTANSRKTQQLIHIYLFVLFLYLAGFFFLLLGSVNECS